MYKTPIEKANELINSFESYVNDDFTETDGVDKQAKLNNQIKCSILVVGNIIEDYFSQKLINADHHYWADVLTILNKKLYK